MELADLQVPEDAARDVLQVLKMKSLDELKGELTGLGRTDNQYCTVLLLCSTILHRSRAVSPCGKITALPCGTMHAFTNERLGVVIPFRLVGRGRWGSARARAPLLIQ